jgi:hypothetical protein
MKTSAAVKVMCLLLIGAFLATPVFGGQPKDKSSKNKDKPQYAYVFVTGSNIPRKVKLKPVGNTISDLSVYNRKEIDQSGRVTTAGVLAQDPSATVRGR